MQAWEDRPGVAGLIDKVPIRNLWLLMFYASSLYRILPRTDRVHVEQAPDEIPDLVAEILCHEVSHLIRRGLACGFQIKSDDLHRLRGRINVLRTENRLLLQRGRVACTFDDVTIDTPHNRYALMALVRIAPTVGTKLAHRCRSLAGQLVSIGVTPRMPPAHEVELTTVWRSNAGNALVLTAARLAFDLSLPTEDPGSQAMRMPSRDSHWARYLFEKAVGGFLAVTLDPQDWHVHPGKKLHWQKTRQSAGIAAILPSMKTDIVLEYRKSDRIIIDTKFTSILQPGHHTDWTLNSNYLYQMYAYLRSQERPDDPMSLNATGILLHPVVGLDVIESVVIQDHEFRFVTVDLSASPDQIREQLLAAVSSGG